MTVAAVQLRDAALTEMLSLGDESDWSGKHMARRQTSADELDAEAPAGGRAADVFVAVAIALVVFAGATALNLQLGVNINVAVAAGAIVYAALLGLHVLIKRMTRGEDDIDARRLADDFESVGVGYADDAPRYAPTLSDDEAALTSFRPRAPVAQVPLPPLGQPNRAGRDRRPLAHEGPRPSGPPQRPSSPQPYRPASVAELTQGSASPVESDVERIQALVKKLANEINAADEAADAVREQSAQSRSQSRPPRLPPADDDIDKAVGALRQTAEGMRTAPAAGQSQRPPQRPSSADTGPPPIRPVSSPPRQQQSAPPPLSPAQAHVAAVADALVAGRVDVEIEPIVSLADQRTRYYEVSVNVRGPAEQRLVENNAFATLQGTGLLPLFDSARLQRSIGIAQRLAERAKDGRVLSVYCAESLTNSGFLSDVRAALGDGGMGNQIVMGFDQADIRAFTPAEWAAVAELRQLRVGLCVENLAHLDVDLKRLASAGFNFVRINAPTLTAGVRFGGQAVSGADLSRYLAGVGLALIVDHIEDDSRLQRIAALGVPLGQGKVFGGRRQVKLAAARSSHAAA